MRKFSVFLILFLVSSLSLQAEWKRGKLFGADVRALVIDEKNPDTMYIGTSTGEIYSTKDGAASWHNPRAGVPFPGYIVDNLVLDSKNRLWAASWGLWGGGVIAVSADGGVTWSRRDAGLEEFSVRALAIDPQDANRLVAGGLTGVHRSEDSGKSWTKISDQINVESLAIDPRDKDRIYVGTWRQAWRTDDGGVTWKHIANGMVLDTDVFTIRIDAKNADNLWVSTCGWVYNSPDRGETWTRFKEGFNNRRIHDINMDPLDPAAVYAGSVAGLYRTGDSGKTWALTTDESMVINSIGLHPQRPERIVLGTEGDGIYLSQDKGKTFLPANQGLYNVRVVAVASDPNTRNRVYAAVSAGGNGSGVYRSDNGGTSWNRVSKTKLPEILSITVQNDPGARLLAGTDKGFYYSADGIDWMQAEPIATPIRVEKILPYSKTRHFAATSAGVLTSKDGGKSWYRLATLEDRTLDIAIGRLGTEKALFALTQNGVAVFDGQTWNMIVDAPKRGRALAIRSGSDKDLLVVAGLQGMKAGHVDRDRKWHEAKAPAGSFASVFQAARSSSDSLFLTSRDDRQLLVSDATQQGSWRSVTLPIDPKTIVSISADPFDEKRYFIGTLGHGIFTYSSSAGPEASGTSDGHLAGSK